MSSSIQDQLLKAGLISQEQAEKAERANFRPKPPALARDGDGRSRNGKKGAQGKRARGSQGKGNGARRAERDRSGGRSNGPTGKPGTGLPTASGGDPSSGGSAGGASNSAPRSKRKGRNDKRGAASGASLSFGAAESINPATAKLRSDHQRSQKILGDSLLSGRSPEQQARRVAHAELVRLLRRVRVNDPRAEEIFNFVRKQRVRRVFVTEQQRGQLAAAEIAIVGVDGKDHLVPVGELEAVLALEPKAHVFRTDQPDPESALTPVTEVDPEYAGYEVPDSLNW